MRLSLLLLLFIALLVSPGYAAEQKDLIACSCLSEDYWQIWLIDLTKNESYQLTTSPVDKRSPIGIEEGRKIMYRTSNAEMSIIDIQTKEEKQILSKFGIITEPAWSRKNNLLAFTRYEGYLKDESEIWTVGIDGSNQRILTNEPGMQCNPSWSPDGEEIAYASGKTFGTYQIFLMDKDGKNKKELTEDIGAADILPVFSPQGRKIAFVSNRDGNFDIWIMDKDGKNLKNLTQSDSLDTKPTFSPDGKQIVFTSTRGGSLGIWIMNADGGNFRQINDPKRECQEATRTRRSSK